MRLQRKIEGEHSFMDQKRELVDEPAQANFLSAHPAISMTTKS